MTKSELKDLVYQVNGAAIEVHKNLGPGLLESVYHKCLEKEFQGLALEADLRLDFLVENILPVEIKAVEHILPVHEAQIISYLKLLEKPEGLLINFNVTNIFYEGQKTYVNELYRNLED
jgi:hypothetical protein